MKYLLITLLILVRPIAMAQSLFFPAEKNGVKILPQRFEFRLSDETRFRVGNVHVDADQISFKLNNKNEAEFRWPIGLLKAGDLVIKDNTGRALWSTPVAIKGADNAIHQIKEFPEDVLSTLKTIPFFRFCAQKKEAMTSIYLCSRELYLKSSGANFEVLTRPSMRRHSFVEINGRTVSAQGMIFMQNKEETVSLRAILASGVTLEVFTRPRDVEFRDIHGSSTAGKIVVKGVGAEPSDESIKKNASGVWEAELDIQRPQIYLKGEGDIPLSQEFILEGKMQSGDLEVPFATAPQEKTYSSSLVLMLKHSPTYTLSDYDATSTVQRDKNSWNWNLKELARFKSNRRFISVTVGGHKLVGAYDVYRAPRNSLMLGALSNGSYLADYQFWINPKWASRLSYTGSSGAGVEARYLLKSGYHFVDPVHGPTIGAGEFVSIGYFYQMRTPSWLRFFDWIDIEASLRSPGGFYASAQLKSYFKTSWFYQVGAQSAGATLGLGYTF